MAQRFKVMWSLGFVEVRYVLVILGPLSHALTLCKRAEVERGEVPRCDSKSRLKVRHQY
jgi:hypothetical protein